jgi:Ser/Thr protein kinase RdoA (MazF antagonist)
MQAFDELPRSTQIRRIRRLAEIALAAYDLKVIRIIPLQHFLNTTFRVDAYDRSNGANRNINASDHLQRFVLRVSRPGFQNASTICTELLWLQAIQSQTDLVVPEPILARDGSLLTTVSITDVPEARHCALFRWVEGRFHHSSLKPTDMEGVGAFMAKLHQHAQQWTSPAGFIRNRWDITGISGEALGIDPAKSRSHLSLEDCEVLDATAQIVQQAMQELGEGSDVFGLIHADLHQGNYLFHKGKVHAIDFDTSGWGYFVYDISVTFSTLLNRPDLPTLRATFLKGYRKVRPLSLEHEKYIDKFIAARIMGHSLWLAAHIGEPAFGPKAALHVAYQVNILKDFLKRSYFQTS